MIRTGTKITFSLSVLGFNAKETATALEWLRRYSSESPEVVIREKYDNNSELYWKDTLSLCLTYWKHKHTPKVTTAWNQEE
jgi:hypothetical protein